MNTHLNEQEIQQLAEDISNGRQEQLNHVNSCILCKARYDTYLMLFDSLKNVSAPFPPYAFADKVLGAVQCKEIPKPAFKIQLVYFFVMLVAALSLLTVSMRTSYTDNVSTGIHIVFLFGFVGFVFICLSEYLNLFKRTNYFEGFTL